MKCITVTLFDKTKNPQQTIWVTQHLTDRLFNAGFRIVNPEFNATSTKITEDTESLLEFLETIDSSDYNGQWEATHNPTPRQRFLRKYEAHDWRSR